MTMDKPRSKKANALHQNVKAQPPRTQSNTALYAGLRFHNFSDGEVIG